MTLFFIAFFSLYSFLHLYFLLKMRSAFGLRPGYLIMIIPFLILMIFSPVIIRQAERHGLDTIARVLSYAGYTWMGLLVLFCFISVFVDLLGFLFNRVSDIFGRDPILFLNRGAVSFIIPSALSILIAFYGFFEARDIRVERFRIRTPKVQERIRIVQLSDVHVGLIIREDRVRRILQLVKAQEPDILVSTGDLVDGQIDSLGRIAEEFKGINPRYGKYAITGNHEFYAGLEQALEFTERAGFRVLRGEGVTVADTINIAGVEDPAGRHYGLLYIDVSEKDLLSRLPEGKFTLLLKHRPTVNRESIGLFDLQLSGHTHKGQIFPFSILTWLYYPVHAGVLNIKDNSYLYVSRGTGTWGPPIRFLSPPEITVIDIFPEQD